MIELHHLNNSRSQRVAWLLEEIGLPYNVITYERDAVTMLAPEALSKIHPIGKSPVIRDGDVVLAESGAIVEYLSDKYASGRLAPKADAPERPSYLYWLHYAEGSLMPPILLVFYEARLGHTMSPDMKERIARQLGNHFAMVEKQLANSRYFLGDAISGADIMMSFVLEMAMSLNLLHDYPRSTEYLSHIHGLPGYKAALAKSNSFDMAGLVGNET